MKQFVLEHLSKACQNTTHIAACRTSTNGTGADLVIDLASGRTIAVYIINRAIRLPEIQARFEQNTARRVYTLFLLDGRMLPQENDEVEPPHWMAALHAVADGRIYAYWCDQRKVTIRPVHMEWKWGDEPRRVAYGPAVSLSKLRTGYASVGTKHISGSYAVADFGDAAFWKKSDPNAEKEFRYSWREWSFGGKPRTENQQQAQQDFDPFEAFRQHYGDTGGHDETVGNRSRRYKQRQRRQQTTQAVYNNTWQDYQTLGVSIGASFDEVKQAYRQKAREYHPDLHPTEKEKYTAKMADINAAFESISRRLK